MGSKSKRREKENKKKEELDDVEDIETSEEDTQDNDDSSEDCDFVCECKTSKKVSLSDYKKKNQNLMAIAVMGVGLFFGSVFVDVMQLVTKEGFSIRKIEGRDVFEAKGKTWVAFEDPIINTTVLTDDQCEDCNVEPIIEAMKKTALPTTTVTKLDVKEGEGKKLIEKLGVKAIPVFVFDKSIEKTEFFEKGKMVLEEKEGKYVLNNSMAGIPYGDYVQFPEFNSSVEILGNKEAKLEVTIFGDFQCPYSKQFGENFSKVFESYKDKVKVSFRHFPLSFHDKAFDASHASLCANEQGKFWEIYKELYAKQAEWGGKDVTGTTGIDRIASGIGLNMESYKKCMDEKKYKGAIEEDLKLAEEFNIGGTPAVFVGKKFISGLVDENKIKSIIEDQLKSN